VRGRQDPQAILHAIDRNGIVTRSAGSPAADDKVDERMRPWRTCRQCSTRCTRPATKGAAMDSFTQHTGLVAPMPEAVDMGPIVNVRQDALTLSPIDGLTNLCATTLRLASQVARTDFVYQRTIGASARCRAIVAGSHIPVHQTTWVWMRVPSPWRMSTSRQSCSSSPEPVHISHSTTTPPWVGVALAPTSRGNSRIARSVP
jgi:hypothetical protein